MFGQIFSRRPIPRVSIDEKYCRAMSRRPCQAKSTKIKEIASLQKIDELKSFHPVQPPKRQDCVSARRNRNQQFSDKIKLDIPKRTQKVEYPEVEAKFEGPISPRQAVDDFGDYLTDYEKKEIFKFNEIYFIGKSRKKIHAVFERSKKSKSNYISNKKENYSENGGFDDADRFYKIIIGDHIYYRYEILSFLGKGGFGQVVKCYDHKAKMEVAIKILSNRNVSIELGQVEAAIIKKLNEIDPNDMNHIIRSYDHFMFRNHLCGTYEMLGQSLYQYQKSINFKPLEPFFIRPIAKQILIALQFCHKNKIVHCDVKPENILFIENSFSEIKLTDFGSSLFEGHRRYDYIQSRFYRAPEVILGLKYGPPVDMWGFGCILAELIIGRPLFPANDTYDQLEMFFSILGRPPKYIINRSPYKAKLFNPDGTVIRTNGGRLPFMHTNIQGITHITDKLLLDLLLKCFEWDQINRITPEEALQHPWFKSSEIGFAQSSPNFLPSLF